MKITTLTIDSDDAVSTTVHATGEGAWAELHRVLAESDGEDAVPPATDPDTLLEYATTEGGVSLWIEEHDVPEPRIEILHERDPDSECSTRLFLNGSEVTEGIESVDVDPGRGHTIDDWLESKAFAMEGASEAFAAAVGEAYDTGAESQYVEGEPTSDVRVHFQPEAWVNDHAIPVDDQGEDTWAVTVSTAERIADALAQGSDLDFARNDDNAPMWACHWVGPFTITVVEDDDA